MAVRKVGYQEGMYQAQVGAWRSFGRKHPVFFMLYPYIAKLATFAAFLIVPLVLWFLVPHLILGTTTLGLAMIGTGSLAVRLAKGRDLQARMMSRARGMGSAVVSPNYAVGAFAVAMLGASWLSLMSPWA
jgi:hypothetical protein